MNAQPRDRTATTYFFCGEDEEDEDPGKCDRDRGFAITIRLASCSKTRYVGYVSEMDYNAFLSKATEEEEEEGADKNNWH